MAYRFLNPAPVFRSVSGEENIPGGVWEFYERDTTTPKPVYADPEGTIPNGTTIDLDASARLTVEAWLVGEYTAVLKDADGATVTTKIITSGQPSGLEIPALEAGFLTNDLSNLLWQDIEGLLLPDPTGSADHYVITDGENYLLAPIPEPPEIPEPDIVVETSSFTAGVSDDPTKYNIQTGTGSATASNQLTATATITFATPFDNLQHVSITPSVTGVTSNSPPGIPTWAVTGYSPGSAASNVTVTFYMAPVQTISSEDMISANVTFTYAAFGTVEVAE